MLKACQPTWKIHIEALVAKKQEIYDQAAAYRDNVEDQLKKVTLPTCTGG